MLDRSCELSNVVRQTERALSWLDNQRLIRISTGAAPLSELRMESQSVLVVYPAAPLSIASWNHVWPSRRRAGTRPRIPSRAMSFRRKV